MSGLVNLECLTLESVNLYDSIFRGLVRLKRIELTECNYEHFKSESFRYVPNLEGLIITRPKKYSNIKFQELGKLKWLHLDELPDYLKYFNFEIRTDFILELANLTYLKIKFYIFTSIIPEWFSRIPKLKLLDLSESQNIQLTKESFSYLRNLKSLCLRYSRISQFDNGVFSYLENLENLDFSKNYIRQLKPEVFDGLNKLRMLYMSGLHENFQLDLNLFQVLPSLKTVFLGKLLKETMEADLSDKYVSNIKFNFQ